MAYSERFLEFLELPVDTDLESFSNRLEEIIPETPLSGLISDQTKQTLIDNFDIALNFTTKITTPNTTFSNSSAYHEIHSSINGTLICRVLELHKISSFSALASDGERLLLLFIAQEGFTEFPFLAPSGPGNALPFQNSKFNVIFEWTDQSAKETDLISSIYAPSFTPLVAHTDYNTHATVSLNPNGFYTKLEDFSILNEAVSESRIKWRFLLLYRILEHGYIRNLLELIQQNIFFKPKDTLTKATETLTNEYSQLTNLIEQNGLIPLFDKIQKATHHTTNLYLGAIKEKLEQDSRAKNGKPFQKGAYIIYQIRCSIVHAGEMSIFYDKYPDAESGLHELYDLFDNAVFKYLGIEYKK
ncbi:hypothetical protein [Pseudomonas sp. LjRoot263]|uniref:hypothetical protein n=1 Tax=Pseudomonas sp. LjRoot263 TaxID=3342302 RepID=UPI003ECF779D